MEISSLVHQWLLLKLAKLRRQVKPSGTAETIFTAITKTVLVVFKTISRIAQRDCHRPSFALTLAPGDAALQS
ncbi:hypothetical protein LJR030_003453 [Rhizobium sp. LjRoot30]|uniref:hypothetical protein n=1 Tax=Rhizobium sp. LjRoot30 TaxID=3342320 RepID=UPI003ED0A9E8